MATPKGVPTVSTPKNPHTSTPSRPTASPRPNTATFGNKTLSYKSPAVKTPSSLQGHSHRVSVSSHPTSTPLAAPAIHDELLNLNSPAAALIASIGNTGLTPMATGQDGLGINTGLASHSVKDMLMPPRNPETEKLHRLEQVTRLLKTKIAGRGVTREGVERIAQIQGFTIFWDEENLTIAGNSVDLEITFDNLKRDNVRDVQLRLNTSGSEEPQLQKEASDVLKKHLMVFEGSLTSKEAWKSLEAFSQDLEYLSQLDYTDSSANCFELMGDLYTAFRQIWDEEKKRMRERSEANHVCQGNIGKPFLHGSSCLGITTRYWVDRQTYHAITDDSMALAAERETSWIARFSCEKGSPGISIHKNWLEDEPLKTTVTTEDVFQDIQNEKPNWSDSSMAKDIDDRRKNANTMMLDGPENQDPETLDLTFTCHLDTMVMVPINVVTGCNSQYQMVQIDESRVISYQKALLADSNNASGRDWNPSIRWSKLVQVFDKEGQLSTKTQSYSLFGNSIPWVYPVTELKFSHPRQYADVLPVLRQYALLWSILRNTFGGNVDLDTPKSEFGPSKKSVAQSKKVTITRRSNKRPAQDELDKLLSSLEANATLRIDISLDLLTDMSKAKLEIIIPVASSADEHQGGSFIHVTIEIRRNGLLDIPLLRGLSFIDDEKLKQKALKVLGLSEDLSVLVEWLLGEVKKTS